MGNETIGDVSKMTIITNPQSGDVKENITFGNFTINADGEATYQNVDTAARALVTLSYNAYVDTILTTEISTDEKLAG